MKNAKKIVLALVLVAMMIASMIPGVAATYDPSIKVVGLDDSDTITFYQILEWKGENGAYGGWSLTTQFAGFADDYADEAAAIKAIIGDPAGNPSVLMGLTSEIAGKLADLASSGTEVTISGGEAELTIDDEADIGLYMALITPGQDDVIYNPVFVSADFNTTNETESWEIVTSAASYSDSAAAKKSKVFIDKKAEKDNGTTYDQTWTSTRIGEKVNFTVDTIIPGYGEIMENPHFVVKDKLTYMELVGTPVLVKPAGLKSTDYTISGGNGDTGYTVTFSADYLKTVKAPTDVQITYTAKVTTDAPLNVNTEKNEVWIEYNHDTTNEDDYKVKKDDTEHYTYTIDADLLGGYSSEARKSGREIVKVGQDASGNPITETYIHSDVTDEDSWQGPLAGAKFKLYTADPTGKTGNALTALEYTTVDGNTLSLESTADGRITITGLDAGTYWLLETEAPNGYIRDTSAHKIEIKPTFRTETRTEWYDKTNDKWSATEIQGAKSSTYTVEVLASYTVEFDGQEAATYNFWNDGSHTITVSDDGTTELPSSIVNTKGVELPSTGGIGTTIFYIGGSILVLAAVILLVTKRRMSAED